MKKLYLLALLAGTAGVMNAQTWTTKAPDFPQEGTTTPSMATPIVKKQGDNSLLRAAENTQLPDSVIITDNQGVNASRNVYKYDENGKITSLLYNAWGTRTNTWSDEFSAYNTYKYDENGNEIYHTFEGWNGKKQDSQITNNVYDEQNRLLIKDIVGKDNHTISTYTYTDDQCVFYKIDTVFSEKMVYHSFEIYLLDEKGNHVVDSIFNFNEVDENNNIKWQLSQTITHAYDNQDREIAATTNFFNEKGYYGKIEKTINYPGDGIQEYLITQQTVQADGSLGGYRADKCEVEAGNPTRYTYSAKTEESSPWTITQIANYYYPEGTVANETIEADAAPTIKAYATNGTLFINTNETQNVQIYSIAGVCYYNVTVNGNIAIANLPAGIYIVKVGNKAMKLNIK